MLELEIDGKKVEVPEGSTVMDAAHRSGTYIPHFCYHKKLSIAANCRMCLVQIEKAPKPMPACATAVTNGMKVFTHSDMAVKAQKSVMEFLLINHPLDCPICDQGGECQLQDVAVGYGASASKYAEEKRVVPNKDIGPLVATDMTRCINCTRCVRFTQEIAGKMELGQAFRNEHAEIMPFLGETVDSELSGNLIDLCPVGALTSKPFRFSARTWELSRRKSVSPHDSLGSNLIVQTKHDRVMRVLPLENEEVNECWISDKDRFSYEGLNSPDRLTKPMVKQGGDWREVDWNVALDYVSHALRDVVKSHGADSVGALGSPHSTLEELYLLQKLVRGLGSDNVDFRLRQRDFSVDGKRKGTPWLGMKLGELSNCDRVLVVGSFLRKDHPLIAQRLRQAAKRGAQVSLLHCAGDDPLVKLKTRLSVAPSELPAALAQILKAACMMKDVPVEADVAGLTVSDEARSMAESLLSGSSPAILLGNLAQHHLQAAVLNALAERLAVLVGGKFGFLGEGANSVGGYLAHAVPSKGLNAAAMLAQPRKAYLYMGAEPDLDCADGRAAMKAFDQAATVIGLTCFKSTAMLGYADVLLPVAPFTETSGSFVNTEGRLQSFYAVTKPQGDTRPGWKVLRVLGNLLELDGFAFESSEDVRAEALRGQSITAGDKQGFVTGLENGVGTGEVTLSLAQGHDLEVVSDVPIHSTDPLVRRSGVLQQTADAQAALVSLSPATATRLGMNEEGEVRLVLGEHRSEPIKFALDGALPETCVRVAAAHPATVGYSGALTLRVERA